MLLVIDYKNTHVYCKSTILFVKRADKEPQRIPIKLLEQMIVYGTPQVDLSVWWVLEGLDPALGFLHQPRSGRDSLMLDVLEPFRTGVDLFALQLLQQLEPSDFSYHKKQGCRLNKKKRALFFASWSQYRQKWPRLSMNTEENNNKTYRYSPIQEQLRGEITQFRKMMAFHYEKVTT